MAIDRGDYHVDSAGSIELACRHIGLYLWWAAERGLASTAHDPAEVAQGPTGYFIRICDAKLWDEDFNDEGLAFTGFVYESYLGELSRYARELGVDDYQVPQTAELKDQFFGWLDRKLEIWKASGSRTSARHVPADKAAKLRAGKRKKR